MKLVALQTVKADGTYVKPWPGGEVATGPYEFDVKDEKEAKALISAGVAREKGKADESEVRVVPVAENTAPRGPASGATSAPSAQAVADAAKGRR